MEGGNEYKKGLWTEEEDRILMEYIRVNGKGKWNRVNKVTGLKRCGKSCRLRWMNYLSPNVKRGDFSEEEEDLIIRLHNLLGNRWSLIAGRVPGRTDNQVKNHWNTHLSKKLGASSKKGKTKKPKTSSLQTLISKEQVKEHFCVPSESNSEQSELQPLPNSINSNSNSNSNINGDEEAAAASASASFGDNVMMNDNIGSISAVGLSSMWEAMMGNNNYDSSSSFWFYNDDRNLYSSYFMDPSLDDHYPLQIEDGL